MDLAKLKLPFSPEDIEWRVAQSGIGDNGPWAKILAYITARACQERLDEVFGPLGWKCEYIPQEFVIGQAKESAFICRLSVRDEKGEWVYKEDGAGLTDFEAFKGGISGAFKRVCASGYGIGRYLYGLTETWAECSKTKQNGFEYAKTKDGVFYWRAPSTALPSWALPAGMQGPQKQQPPKQQTAQAPAPAQQQSTDNGQFLHGLLADVTRKIFKDKKTGEDKPYWVIKMSNGDTAATFEKETGKSLESAVGKLVEIPYVSNAKGQKTFVEFSFRK